MARKLSDTIPRFTDTEPAPHQPLSLPHHLAKYDISTEFAAWQSVLSGVRLDMSTHATATVPPSLNLWRTEELFLANNPEYNLEVKWDVDSVLFFPTSLAVFTSTIDWAFMPPFNRSGQPNQRVTTEGVEMTKTKCIWLGTDGRYDCHIFFPHMPFGSTQHLNNHALGIWTDQILLPSFDAVCDTSTRQHYPSSFAEIRTKVAVKKEAAVREGAYSQVDIRKAVRPNLLGPLWESITSLAANVESTELPPTSFSNPKLLVSSHNLKGTELGGHSDFDIMRKAFFAQRDKLWNVQYTSPTEFWVDVAKETTCDIRSATLIRKSMCNREYAGLMSHPSGAGRPIISEYTMACTDGGAITVETPPRNPFRGDGWAYNKFYNVIKEQFYTAMKNHSPFENPNLEMLAYSKEQIARFADGRRNGGVASSVTRDQLINQEEATKQRLAAALIPDKAQSSAYSERSEMRMTVELFNGIPDHLLTPEALHSTNTANSHRPFWILPTTDINAFRLADANRFVLCLEVISTPPSNSAEVQRAAVHQQRDALLSTALARTLKLSLGGGNPHMIPALWRGKRWVRKVRKEQGVPNRAWYQRQGLEYGESAQKHGMIWLPHRLLQWGDRVPYFRIGKYRHLDIAFDVLHDNKARAAVANAKSYHGQLLQFITSQIITTTDLSGDAHITRMWTKLFFKLAELCIQEYNLTFWQTIKKRWIKHAKGTTSEGMGFEECARLSEHAQSGLEVLTFVTLRKYLERNLEHPGLLNAKATDKGSFPSWADRTWHGRVIPIFDPGKDSPAWVNRSKTGKRIIEIENRFTEAMGETTGKKYAAGFRTALHRIATTRVQAILHYNKTEASTLQTATKDNSQTVRDERSQQSEFERTKFMFPKVHPDDQQTWTMAKHGTLDKSLTTMDLREISSRWLVFHTSDKGDYREAASLMRDGRYFGPTATNPALTGRMHKAREFHRECEAWVEELQGQDGEDSDWPDRPTLDDIDEGSDMTESNSEESD